MVQAKDAKAKVCTVKGSWSAGCQKSEHRIEKNRYLHCG